MSRTNDNKQPMTKALFLEKLSIHGADFTRWDGYDAAEAQSFLDKNDGVKDAYEQAKALDQVLDGYKVPADLDVQALIKKASTQIEQDKVVGFASAKDKAAKRKAGMAYYWGGGVAIAASLMLLMVMQPQTQTQIQTQTFTPRADVGDAQSVELAMADVDAATENPAPAAKETVVAQLAEEEARLFATWEQTLTEDFAEREIISLWEMADASTVAMPEAPITDRSTTDAAATPQNGQIDRFIENNYVPAEDEVLEREMDLWELYLKSEG